MDDTSGLGPAMAASHTNERVTRLERRVKELNTVVADLVVTHNALLEAIQKLGERVQLVEETCNDLYRTIAFRNGGVN